MGAPTLPSLDPQHGCSVQRGWGEDEQVGGRRGGSLTWEDEDEEGTDAADDADDLAKVWQEQGHGERHGDPQDSQ